MQRVLNQEEIDAIVQASRGLKSSSPKEEKSVQACDFRQAGQLSREVMQAVSGMYESFARNLSQALGLYLPVAIQTLLVSVEQLTYKDFLVRTPEITLLIFTVCAHSLSAPGAELRMLGTAGRFSAIGASQSKRSTRNGIFGFFAAKLFGWHKLHADLRNYSHDGFLRKARSGT